MLKAKSPYGATPIKSGAKELDHGRCRGYLECTELRGRGDISTADVPEEDDRHGEANECVWRADHQNNDRANGEAESKNRVEEGLRKLKVDHLDVLYKPLVALAVASKERMGWVYRFKISPLRNSMNNVGALHDS